MKKGILIGLAVVIAVIIAAKFVFLDRHPELLGPQRIETEPEPAPAPQPPAPAQPEIRYPIEPIRVEAGRRDMPETEPPEPLPALAASDEPVRQALADMSTMDRLAELVIFDSIIRRFVVTVDNMTRSKLPQKYRFAEEVPGQFLVKETDETDRFVLDPENYERYGPFVDLFEVVDLRTLAGVYARFYPLFQQAYEELGYPDRYFNDRLIEVIDHLQAAPEVRGPVELVRPKVFYQFADPELESLSAGQKLMIRMGPVNAERVKARLEDLRRLLVAGGW